MRRYPVAGYALVAALLAVLLPSGLTLPNTGPPTVAEYAPVPGQGAGSNDQGNLGAAGSHGLGVGTGQGTGPGRAAPTKAPPPPGGLPQGQANPPPNQFACVKQSDGIYHQTEDPLSPPCVTYVPPDNGGASGAPGVSRTEVRVVLQLLMQSPTDRVQRAFVDCDAPIDLTIDRVDELECKAYAKFFNRRYDTYGRHVHLYGYHPQVESAGDVIAQFHPFAYLGLNATSAGFASQRVLSLGYGGTSRVDYTRYAPYVLSFLPDQEDAAAISAGYVCRRLEGGPADLTTDPTLAGKPRKFGYWGNYQQPRPYDNLVLAELKRQCGIDVRPEYVFGAQNATFAAKLKADGVTTVLAQFDWSYLPTVTGFASKAAYFPEWVVVPDETQVWSTTSNLYGRTADPSEWRQAIGLSFDYRRDGEHQQMWYRAYATSCAGCPAPDNNASASHVGPELYDELQLLFYALQLGGPRLTAQTIDQGLHAIPETASPSPYRPAAYLTPGNYSFIKDAVGLWWDPQGRTPEPSAPGCYRLVGGGVRHRAGEWPHGDTSIKGNQADPCQGDPVDGE